MRLDGDAEKEYRDSVSSRPTREAREGSLASPSTLTRVVSVAASLRYDDGKTLKGIGTLASKSRLTEVKESFLECLPNRIETIRKEDKKRLLLQGGRDGGKKARLTTTMLLSFRRRINPVQGQSSID